MYCPVCKTEYNPGITVCADCGTTLVEQLPDEQEVHSKEDYVEAFRVLNEGDIAVIKSIWDAANIDYIVYDENLNLSRPLVEGVRFMVNKEQISTAMELISDIEIHPLALSTDREWKGEDEDEDEDEGDEHRRTSE